MHLHHTALLLPALRDSFGVQCNDSFPDLFMPIGFAGGLVDPDTGLTRFGYRDYDPTVGRFTAPDPAKDRRGDGDLYDYCVDDPVNSIDTTGLFWGWVGKRAAKWAGKKIGKSFSNDSLNDPEEIIDVRNRIQEVERKIEEGTVTEDEIKSLEKNKRHENALWKKHGKHYIKHEKEFYRRYFPDDDYANRKVIENSK